MGGASARSELRVAIVCSPRSGSHLLQWLLGQVYDLTERQLHSRDDLWTPDSVADARLVLRVPLRPVPDVGNWLKENGFQQLALARHPLDIAVSFIRLVRSLPASTHQHVRQWAGGAAIEHFSGERETWTSPRSEPFMDFATGPFFGGILSPMCEGWRIPGVGRVRFEDLRRDPAGELDRIVGVIGQKPIRPTHAVARAMADEDAAKNPGTPWLTVGGIPDGWRRVLPALEARRIAHAHAEAFETLGYVCDPDESLTPEMADLNWYRFDAASAHHLADTRDAAVTELTRRLQAYEGIGPGSLAVARRLAALGHRFSALRSLARVFRGDA